MGVNKKANHIPAQRTSNKGNNTKISICHIKKYTDLLWCARDNARGPPPTLRLFPTYPYAGREYGYCHRNGTSFDSSCETDDYSAGSFQPIESLPACVDSDGPTCRPQSSQICRRQNFEEAACSSRQVSVPCPLSIGRPAHQCFHHLKRLLERLFK